MTPTGPPRSVAVLLAAGAGSRFHGSGHKLLAEIDGTPIAARAIDAARRSGIGPVVVVTGAVELPEELTTDVIVANNPRWADGQATSLRVAIRTATELGATAIVVGLADQPFVEPEAWRRVAASRSPIAVATYAGRRRNPVRLAASVWPLLPLDGDEGARSLTRMRPDLVDEVPCPGSADDIDTLEELQSWQRKSSTNSR